MLHDILYFSRPPIDKIDKNYNNLPLYLQNKDSE